MRIFACNVAQNVPDVTGWLDTAYGGIEKRAECMAERILLEKPDTVVLTELQLMCPKDGNFKNLINRGAIIKNKLEGNGYTCALADTGINNSDSQVFISTFIAHKGEFTPIIRKHTEFVDKLTKKRDGFRGRNWCGAEIDYYGQKLRIIGVHVPNSNDYKVRETFCEAIEEEIDKSSNTIIIGDFNAFSSRDMQEENDNLISEELSLFTKANWVDAWEKMHKSKRDKDIDRFTYYIKQNNSNIHQYSYCPRKCLGRRLDYSFLSPELIGEVVYVEHLHDIRTNLLSDHSALVVELR